MQKIAVLIPCYNESQAIAQVIQDFRQALPTAEIYVYDNNSTDNTAEIARQAGAIVRHEYRQGKGNVVRSMFRDIVADCYIMVDGDNTYPAENAAEMCRLVLEEGVDMVIGDRLSSTYFTENKRPFHNSGNRFVCYCINKIFKSSVRDVMTGYRAFSQRFVKHFPVMRDGFELETEMTLHALDKKFYIHSLPINYRDRQAGSVSKLNTYKDGFKVIRTIVCLFRDYKPMLFFKNTSPQYPMRRWLACVFGGRSLLLSLLFVGMVCVVIKNNDGYHWVWNGLLKGNWELIRKYPDLSLEQRSEMKMGANYVFLNYIKNNTPDTAIILFPEKQVLTKKFAGFQLGPDVTTKMWVTHFIYPRIPLYRGSEDTTCAVYKSATHRVVLGENGYKIQVVL